jgi:Fic family protein
MKWRTARAIFYWYMLKKGYWLTECPSQELLKTLKLNMKKSILYSEADGNDLGYFITYHIMTMEKSYAIENVH